MSETDTFAEEKQQLSDSQSDSVGKFGKFVESWLQLHSSDETAHYAWRSYSKAVGEAAKELPSVESLRLWLATMQLATTSIATRRRYLGKLHTLALAAEPSLSANDPFETVTPLFSQAPEAAPELPMSNLQVAEALLRRAEFTGGDDAAYIFYWLLFHPEKTLTEAITLTLSALNDPLPQVSDLLETATAGSRRLKYVFNLRQGKDRMPHIERELVRRLRGWAAGGGMHFGGEFSRASLVAIWIAAALRCSIPVADIASLGLPIADCWAPLRLVTPHELTDERRQEIFRRVADEINPIVSQWFVMRMRRGVTPEDISQRAEETLSPTRRPGAYYYPSRKKSRRVGKKIVREEIPYIPYLLFFRTRRDRVEPLLAAVTDLAWCYRQSNRPGSPYSVISRQEMERFQRFVGQFTPDISLEVVEKDEGALPVGTTVKVSSGIFSGREGVIQKVANSDGSHTYRLLLSGTTALRWTVTLDESELTPLDNS